MKQLAADPEKCFNRLEVDFGREEQAIDFGGPGRQFLESFVKLLTEKCFHMVHSGYVLQRSVHREMAEICGLAVGYSLIHGGGKFPLAEYLYEYAIGGVTWAETEYIPSMADVPESRPFRDVTEICGMLLTIHKSGAETAEAELSEYLSDPNVMEKLMACNWDLENDQMFVETLDSVVAMLLKEELIFKRKSSFDSFTAGLAKSGLLDTLQRFPKQMRSVFAVQDLRAEVFLSLLDDVVDYEESDGVGTERKKLVHEFFKKYIREGEHRTQIAAQETVETPILNQLLRFISAVGHVPARGMKELIRVDFESFSSTFPTAQTCFSTVKLPTRYGDYKEFEEKLDEAIREARGFGLL